MSLNTMSLHKAVEDQDWTTAIALIEQGADVNKRGPHEKTPLFEAVCQFDAPENLITRLISPENINKQDRFGTTPMHVAIRQQRWDIVPILLRHGADMNVCDDRDMTVLHEALYYGNVPCEVVKSILSDCNINKPDSNGNTPLHLVVKIRRRDIIPMLVRSGADINSCNVSDETPLHRALHTDLTENIFSLLISDENIEVTNRWGKTALQLACEKKKWEYVRLLVQHGAVVDIKDEPEPYTLRRVCIQIIRRTMRLKNDDAFESLGLPSKLLPSVKLLDVAQRIIEIVKKQQSYETFFANSY